MFPADEFFKQERGVGNKLRGVGGEGKGGKVYVPLNFYNSVSPQVCTKHEVSPVNTGTKRQHPDSNGSDNSTVDMVCWCTLTSPSDLHRGEGGRGQASVRTKLSFLQ